MQNNRNKKNLSLAPMDLSFIGSKDDIAETRSVESRVRIRSVLDSDVDKFLKSGGKINSIKSNVIADPPKRPESSYGSKSI